MPSVPHITRIRRRRWRKTPPPALRRGGLAVVLVISLLVAFLLISLTLLYADITRDLPSPETLSLLLEPPGGFLLQPTRFYDRSGTHVIQQVENPAIAQRVYLTYDTPQHEPGTAGGIVNATIAISDPAFWAHPGFSFQGIAQNTHDTLAQKLVSTLLLWNEPPGIESAVRERILAAQITHQYGRNKVMEWYLNSADYGNLAFGIEAAAQVYFGKPANRLKLAEAAILAAVAESPVLNPHTAPKTALERGQIVLDAMAGQGLITPQQVEQARATPISFRTQEKAPDEPAAAFLKLAWERLSETIPLERLERGGFEIITTMDYDLQGQVSCATQAHQSRLVIQAGLEPGGATDANDFTDCPAAQLLPSMTLEDGHFLPDLAIEVIVYDPRSGEVLAMAAENPPEAANRVPSQHPAGTLVTPFIYVTAFTRGFNPASLLWDIPLDQEDYAAAISEGPFRGPVRLRTALANDYLSPAIQVTNQIGIETVRQTTQQLGLEFLSDSDPGAAVSDCPGCKLLLEGGDLSLAEAAQSFGVFSNWGNLVGQPSQQPNGDGLEPLFPTTIRHVADANQQYWLGETEVRSRPVISQQLAYLILDILKDEDARWPSLGHPNPLEIGRPAGAKIGTTIAGSDVWTIGFTPQLVVGVWAGTPTAPEPLEVPSKIASTLWRAVMQHATREYPVESWQVPAGVTTVDVCDPSGMLPTLQCPAVVSEVFLSGQEPTQPDTLFQSLQINRETGRLATVYTPPELIEARTFMKYPPEASAWAESAGLETPPEIYDVIYAPPVMADAHIRAPAMFDYLNGQVSIQGQASGGGFESFRLQVGEGLNPRGWTVVQNDTQRPVENGVLGTWDTTGLNGLYALQLIVLRENQQVDTHTIQVTVDNLPPAVTIPYPVEGNIYLVKAHPTLTFLVQAEDNTGLDHVDFYLDGSLIASQTQSPFAYPWSSRTGKHTLIVKAIDRAGNISQASVNFTME